jgi:hypothetical protein
MPFRVAGRGLAGRRLWIGSFLALWLISAAWALSMPAWSGPDERMHVVRGASLVRGRWLGTPVPGYPSATAVRVPAALVEGTHLAGPCFRLDPQITAACARPVGAPGRMIGAQTWTGRYPPLYYGLTAWTTLLDPATSGITLMRLVGAAVAAALLASAVVGAASARRGRMLLGLLTALTPVAVYLNGIVNPNGLEVSAAIATWVSALSLVDGADPGQDGSRIRRLMISMPVLALCRAGSPLFLALIAGIVAVTMPRSRLVALFRRRDMRVLCGLTIVACAVAATYTAVVHANRIFPVRPRPAPGSSAFDALLPSARYTGAWLTQAVGTFGWDETRSPAATYYVWGIVVVGLVGVGLVRGSSRERIRLCLIAVTALVVPILLQALTAPAFGYFWHGRYSLPLLVGIPLAAAHAIEPRPDRRPRSSTAAVVVLLGAAQFGAFWWALRRYAVGSTGPLLPAHPAWRPIVDVRVCLLVYLLLLLVVGTAAIRLLRARTPDSTITYPVPRPRHRRPTPLGSPIGGSPRTVVRGD